MLKQDMQATSLSGWESSLVGPGIVARTALVDRLLASAGVPIRPNSPTLSSCGFSRSPSTASR
jgi:hypothetical protein